MPKIFALNGECLSAINGSLLAKPSLLMEKAIHLKALAFDTKTSLHPNDLPNIIALPLIANDEVLGAIELERVNKSGFADEDLDLIKAGLSIFAVQIKCMQQNKILDALRNNTGKQTIIDEIRQSILSNLDRDSLLNNIISLLHQIYGFPRVYIFTARFDDKTVLKKTGISQDGFIAEENYYYEQDSGPVGWCVSHLEIVTINDTGSNDKYSPTLFEKNIGSILVLPLLHGDIFIGVLELCADIPNVFVPEAVQILTSLSESIANAIRNADLFHTEQSRRLVADRLHEVIGPISISLPPEKVYKIILAELEAFLPYHAAAIWLKNASSEEIGLGKFDPSYQLVAVQCKDQSTKNSFEPYLENPVKANELITGKSWITEVINSKLPALRIKNSIKDPIRAILGFDDQYSAVAAPLLINYQLVGLLICTDRMPDQYDKESIMIVETFASYSAIAIENARLYHAAHDQAWITTVLLQIAEATQSITNMDELLDTTVNMLPDLLGVSACTIYLWDPTIEAFQYGASNGFNDEQVRRLKGWDITPGSDTVFDNLKENRSPVILDNRIISSDIATEIFPEDDFERSLLILFPLITQNSLCGSLLVDLADLDLDISSSQEVWDEKYSLIQGAAYQVATAIENIQLIKSQEEEAYISVALLQVAQAVVSLKKLDEILAMIVRITPILVGVKRCLIYIWDAKDEVFRQSQFFGFNKNELSLIGQVIKSSEFPFIKAIQQNDQIVYHVLGPINSPSAWNDIEEGDYYFIERITPELDEEISIKLDESLLANRGRLLIGFPLSVKDEILGVMLVEEEDLIRGLPSIHIREKRIEIVKGITQQAAIAIKNELLQQEVVKSERMERELQLAREIQSTFLPDKLPQIPGWDIDARWQPARQVGGDFYDILYLDNNKIGFVIADVADKGMPAALLMILIRTLIRAAATQKLSPAAVLRRVNELLIPDIKQGMFVTVFYCVISLDSGNVVYANAGHNPPIVKQHNLIELQELARTSMALGLFDDIKIEERKLLINPGDWIFFYTDGVTEAFSAQEEMFGKERLINILEAGNFISPRLLLDKVEGSVIEFIHGMDLSDDVTLAALYRKIE